MPAKKYKTIFMGTPEFALLGLRAILNSDVFEIVGVFTQPDKPIGRKQISTPPPIKTLALENNLSVFQPQKIRTEAEVIRNLQPDLIVVIAYGQIIPQEILDIPTFGCINVHASLLPKYRGAACLNAPILNGDTKTGITIMKMDAGLDTGPILRQAKIKLSGRENLSDVHDTLSTLGASILPETLKDFIDGKIKPCQQDDSQASYIKMIKKEDGRIDWNKPATETERMIRAYNPWPGTYAEIDNRLIKIIEVELGACSNNKYPIGKFFQEEGKLGIQCGQGSLFVLKLQPAGKKIMTENEFLNGYQIK
jgi:methionyl-tRNA formyltransferase